MLPKFWCNSCRGSPKSTISALFTSLDCSVLIMPYLTKAEIHAIFESEATAHGGAFWSRVLPDVDWTVMGRGPATGRYIDLATLRAATVERLLACMQGGLQLKFTNWIIGGDNFEWTTVELEARGVTKKGNNYCKSAFYSSDKKLIFLYRLIRLRLL